MQKEKKKIGKGAPIAKRKEDEDGDGDGDADEERVRSEEWVTMNVITNEKALSEKAKNTAEWKHGPSELRRGTPKRPSLLLRFFLSDDLRHTCKHHLTHRVHCHYDTLDSASLSTDVFIK